MYCVNVCNSVHVYSGKNLSYMYMSDDEYNLLQNTDILQFILNIVKKQSQKTIMFSILYRTIIHKWTAVFRQGMFQ